MNDASSSSSPLVTIALFAYNQEDFIQEAVESVLAQAYQPLEIILSDDHSSDRTFEIMKATVALYEGFNRVVVRQNSRNLGLAAHVNEVFENSNGRYILLAAGDDVSLPTRTDATLRIFQAHQGVGSVMLSADLINQKGEWIGERILPGEEHTGSLQCLDDLTTSKIKTFGATRAIDRVVVNNFPPLDAGCPTEDTPLMMRSLLIGGIAVSATKGIRYRQHGNNLSGSARLASLNVEKIHSQYYSDIDYAKSRGWISRKDAIAINKWINRDYYERLIKNKAALGERLKFSEFWHALILRKTSFRYKVGSTLRALRFVGS